MSPGLITKKIGMSRVFLASGEAVPVTYLQVDPNEIVRIKTQERDGYNAVVLGVKPKKWKTRKGKEHTRYAFQKEWKVDSLEGFEPGKQLTAAMVPAESMVTICGTSKGKGFQGVVKRYGFRGGPASHGSHSHREPGSIGMCAFPGHVLKGQKMPGQMGKQSVTLRGRPVIVCDPEKGILGVKGPVPGPNGAPLFITVESASLQEA